MTRCEDSTGQKDVHTRFYGRIAGIYSSSTLFSSIMLIQKVEQTALKDPKVRSLSK